MSTTPIEIFRAGKHTATNGVVLDVSVADLAEIAGAYDPAKHEAPLVIGHPKQDHPAYGWVKGVRVEGDRLVADPDQVDADFADLVDKGRFKKVSASFYLRDGRGNPTPGKLHLKHVGFLGAVPPAVKGLRQVSFAEGDEGTVEFSDWGDRAAARLFRQLREWLIGKFGVDEADKALNSWDLDAVAEAAVTPAPASFADPTPSPEEVARLAEIERREAELDRRTAEFAERDRQARLADHGTFLDALIAQGRVLPKERHHLLNFMSALDEAGTVSFAEGDDKPAGDVFRAFAAAVGPRVPMGEIATGETVDFADEKSITKAADALVKAAAERGDALTFTQAVSQLNKGITP